MNNSSDNSELGPGEYTRQVLLLRQARNYLEQRLKLQHDLHDAQGELIALHREEVDRLRPLVEEREQLIAAIPEAKGNFSVAINILRSAKGSGFRVQSSELGESAPSRPAPVQTRESHCVATRTRLEDGFTLYCDNCGVFVVALKCNSQNPTIEEEREINGKLEDAWAKHVTGGASAQPPRETLTPALSRPTGEGEGQASPPEMEYPGVCTCSCDLCRRGVHCGELCCSYVQPPLAKLFGLPTPAPAVPADPVAVNPNAGVKQAFPNGRWGASAPATMGDKL